MVLTTYFVSSVVMILVLVAIGYYLSRSREREASRLAGSFLQPEDADVGLGDRLLYLANHPIGWTLAFLVVIAVMLGTSILYVAENGIATETVFQLFGGILVLSLLAFLWYGIYRTLRIRGHSRSVSTFETAILIGLLAIVAVAGHLVFIS